MHRKTVVLVCMVDSIHVARWIAQFDPKEIKFILFPSGPNRRVHPKIVDLVERGMQFEDQITLLPFGGKLSLPLWALDRFFSDRIRGLLLRRILKKVEPDFVHALEFQHAGYVTIRALEDKSIKTPFIATNYGSDIYWFQRFPRHARKIRKVLVRAEYYGSECKRDVSLAVEMGFAGRALEVLPNGGPLDLDPVTIQVKPSARKMITVKGYWGWAGMAHVAIRALASLGRDLSEYSIVIYSANASTRILARLLLRRAASAVVYGKGELSREELLDRLAKSRIYIGVSRTDGLSTSMLEAMSVGAFPIQSSTACTSGIIRDPTNGISLSQNSVKEVANAVSKVLSADSLVDSAQQINYSLVSSLFSYQSIGEKYQNYYKII
jgi:glycosyltransferase involved in cell wall biosynthesis